MKKLVSLLLCSCLFFALTLAGCNSESSSQSEVSSESGSTDSTSSTGGASVQDEEPYEVVLEIVTFGQDYRDLPEIEKAINEITLPAINCTVSILNIGIPELAQKNSMMTATGEKMDLMVAGLTTKMPGLVSEGILLPLDDLIAEHGQDLVALFGSLMDAGKVNGVTYAVPADAYPAAGMGFVFNKEVAEELNISLPQTNCSFEDLEAAFEILKNSDYDMYGYSNGTGGMSAMGYFYPITTFGENNNMSYGAIINPDTSTTVENIYASDEYYEYLTKMKEWVDKGYATPDSLTGGINSTELLKAQALFGSGTLYDCSQAQVWNNNMGFPVEVVQTLPQQLTTEGLQEVMWGIPVTSQRPDKVMQFLNFLYSDAGTDVANLLANGLEGVNYKKVSEQVITFADDVDMNDLGYQRIFSRFGNTMNVLQWEPATDGFNATLKEFNDSATVSPLLGYTFDAEPVSVEIAAVVNVISEYRPALECGKVDIDAVLPQFLAALDSAGYGKIIEENQSQLDAWLAENK